MNGGAANNPAFGVTLFVLKTISVLDRFAPPDADADTALSSPQEIRFAFSGEGDTGSPLENATTPGENERSLILRKQDSL